MTTARRALWAVVLTATSVAAGLTISELLLRTVFPRYKYAAESAYEPDKARIWSTPANRRWSGRHPDTGRPHAIIYNNLAMRQHRNFTQEDIEHSINVGIFGDSFTENVRLPVQFSFTEVLDYLLNTRGQEVNVLNFGVDGYGTDQSYLRYRDSPYAADLDHVIYVMHSNDLRNIYEDNLFTVDRAGDLVRASAARAPRWLRLLSNLHLTYLFLEARDKLPYRKKRLALREYDRKRLLERYQKAAFAKRHVSPTAASIENDIARGRESEALESSVRTFRAILYRWKQEVESNGGSFSVVLLPIPTETHLTNIIDPSIDVLDLLVGFRQSIPDYDYDKVRFANDWHWNELGNLLAAKYLYRHLERQMGLDPLSEVDLTHALADYVAAFAQEWSPPSEWVFATPEPPELLSRIRDKYLELELAGGTHH